MTMAARPQPAREQAKREVHAPQAHVDRGHPDGGHRDGGDDATAPLLARGAMCACLQARMTARALTRMYDEALRPTGLKVTQLSLLAAIAQGASGSISALASRLALERTTLTRNLKLLEDAGLIVQRPGAGRAVSHELTEAGQDALARAAPLWSRAQDQVQAALGDDGWRAATESLRALRRSARHAGDGAPPASV